MKHVWLAALMVLILAANHEEPVARLVHFGGTVTVVPAKGKAGPATLDAMLLRKDKVKVGAEGFAILLLRNNHLVRVDEALELAMKDVALLGAEPSTVAPEEQLAALLYPDEATVEAPERLAGWRMGQVSAHTPSSEGRRRRSPPAAKSAPTSPEESASPLPEELALPSGGAHRSKEAAGGAVRGVVVQDSADALVGEPAPSPQQEDEASPSTDAPEGGRALRKAKAKEPGPKPLVLKSLEKDPALRACLSGVPGLDPTKRQVILQVLVRDDRIHRLALEGALVVPACAKHYVGRPVAKAAPRWHKVRIPLK